MGIHYDYKSTRGMKAMEKQAKREKKLAERRAKRASKLGLDEKKTEGNQRDVSKPLTLEDITNPMELAQDFMDRPHALFLGRGPLFPVALEGALKLKEITYIHAEGYPAGELKDGPLALVDEDMPVVAVAPGNELLDKVRSNLEEVRARGGRLYVFADANAGFQSTDDVSVIELPTIHETLAPILYTVPLELLAYHVAVLRGTDVDQPRNLAKSVTVE